MTLLIPSVIWRRKSDSGRLFDSTTIGGLVYCHVSAYIVMCFVCCHVSSHILGHRINGWDHHFPFHAAFPSLIILEFLGKICQKK